MTARGAAARAEEAVLGAILVRQSTLAQVRGILREDDFHSPARRLIFRAMVELDAKGSAIDPMLVANALIQAGEISKLEGGERYLVGLLEATPTAENVVHHARVVADRSLLRRIAAECREVAARAETAEDDAAELAGDLQRRSLAMRVGTESRVVQFSTAVRETLTSIAGLRTGQVRGLTTGLIAIDRMTGGLRGGTLVYVAGRPSMGKSALLEDIVVHVAGSLGIPAFVITPEMSYREWTCRLLAGKSGVPLNQITAGRFASQAGWIAVKDAGREVSQWPIQFDDAGAPTIGDIRADVTRWAVETATVRTDGMPRGIVAVDYVQMVEGMDPRAREEERLTEVSRGLKALAKELDIPVVAAAQLNRGLEKRDDRRPMMADLRGSGSLEQDGDVIVGLYRESAYCADCKAGSSCEEGHAERTEAIFLKQRNGPTRSVLLRFDAERTRFRDWHDEQGG